MSVPSLGFNNTGSNTPPSLSSQILMSSTTTPAIQSITTSCCENGRPIMTDPHTGQSICSCQYGSSLLSAYSRVPGLTDSMYSSPHYATQGYMSLNSADPSAFYSPLNAHYDSLKDNAESAWRSISQPTACYPYDPTMAAYPYGNTYGGMDLNGAARRKNATRETTNTLKAWLYEHRKNPYPTKGEKIMLAIITKMTLTQVSTWFANARRRLKKENKMTWSPRNRCADDEDDSADKNDDDSNDDKDDAEKNNEDRAVGKNKDDKDIDLKPPFSPLEELKKPDFPLSPDTISMDKAADKSLNMQNDPLIVSPLSHDLTSLQSDLKRLESPCSNSSDSGLSDINSTLSANGHNTDPADSLRPRIWSIANVVTSISGNAPNASHPDTKDQSSNLNLSKVPSYVHSSSTMRPWIDSSFNVGSSIFTSMSSYNNNSTGTPRFKDGNQPNHGMSGVNGFSTPSLARPYSSVSSLYSPVRDLSKRGMDKLSDLCS